jgi:thiol:disulfide interchange protein DsbC
MMNITFPRALVASFILMMASSVAGAADESADELTRLLKLRLGTDQVEAPTETDVEGVYQTRFGNNKFAYLIEGGRYVFIGDMVDLKLAKNLTELSRRNLVVDELASFSKEKRIVCPAANEELAILSVFTDTSCGYCQKLHQEVRYLQEAGISVHYFPYPRGGSRGPGYSDMRKVWCSDDQRKAMSIAKGSETGSLESSDSCELAQHVDDGYLLGNRIGVNGTPALYSSDGSMFNGYVPYQQLIPQLINNQ